MLRDVLALASVPLGEQLCGDRLALYVVVEALDRYRVVFALPELDAAFTDRIVLLADRRDEQPLPAAEGPLRLVILADRRDEQPLPAAEGPLRLVIPDEQRRARWVRQVIAIYIRRAS